MNKKPLSILEKVPSEQYYSGKSFIVTAEAPLTSPGHEAG